MSYTLGIRIDGCEIKDRDAKIIALIFYGLTYREIYLVLGCAEKTVRNIVSNFYDTLEVSWINDLMRKARSAGFDFDGRVNGNDVLNAYERKRMLEKVPRLRK